MPKQKTLRYGREVIAVDNKTYAAAHRERERAKKVTQRMRHIGRDYGLEYLDSPYLDEKYQPAADDDTADTATGNILAGTLWDAVNATLDKATAYIVTAYYRDKLTDDEIAAEIGLTRQGVNQRRRNAERKLKDALETFKIFLK